MPPRHMPKGCSSSSAKLQIDFDWSKFGGGLEEVCNHAGILYIYLHFNVLTLCIFNVFYLYFRHGEANGHKIPPKSVRTAGGTPPCSSAGILERYRSHKTNFLHRAIAGKKKRASIQMEKAYQKGSPPGGAARAAAAEGGRGDATACPPTSGRGAGERPLADEHQPPFRCLGEQDGAFTHRAIAGNKQRTPSHRGYRLGGGWAASCSPPKKRQGCGRCKVRPRP